jgi:hypothetical protein
MQGGFMHPLTRFFKYLKRKKFAVALAREHLSDRDLTEWYPDWMYEFMESDEVRNQAYQDVIRATVSGKVVLEVVGPQSPVGRVLCQGRGKKGLCD